MFKINSSRPSKCSEIQSFQGTSPPGPPPGGSEHPLDPSSNKRSLRERIRSLRERDNISYEIKNSIFNKNGLWQKCLDATLDMSRYLFELSLLIRTLPPPALFKLSKILTRICETGLRALIIHDFMHYWVFHR